VGVSVGRGVAVAVAVEVDRDVCVGVGEGVVVRATGALPPQADRKIATSTINRGVYFMETQLYPQAV
jgi:hypothetical protein